MPVDLRCKLPKTATNRAPNAHVSVWKKTQASRDNRHQISKSANQQISKLMFEDSVKKAAAGARAEAIHGQLSEKPRPLVQPR
jgi:hypothetical protein